MFSIDLFRNRVNQPWIKDLKKEDVFYPRDIDNVSYDKSSKVIIDMDISYNEYLCIIFSKEGENNYFSSFKLDWSFDPVDEKLINKINTSLRIQPDNNNFTALKISNQTSNQILALADAHGIYFNYDAR